MLKRVAGVFHVRPIIPDGVLTLRKGRRGHELVQNDGEAMRVVAVSDDKPGLLSFAPSTGYQSKLHGHGCLQAGVKRQGCSWSPRTEHVS